MRSAAALLDDRHALLDAAEDAVWIAYSAEGRRITPFVVSVFETWESLYHRSLIRAVMP